MTEEEFILKIDLSKYKLISNFIDYKTKLLIECSVCKNIWESIPQQVVKSKSRCEKCYSQFKKQKFVEDINKIHEGKIIVLEEYTCSTCKVHVQCLLCEHNWFSSPDVLKKGHGCWKCGRVTAGLNGRTKHEEYVKKVDDYHNGNIKILDIYEINTKKINAQCNKCGHIWNVRPSNLYNKGCPKCRSSKGEKLISSILDNLNIKYKQQHILTDRINNKKFRFDFAVINNDLVKYFIEYDGEQHFKPVEILGGLSRFNQQIINDKLKNQYCINNHIKLVRIPYWFKNILNESIMLKIIEIHTSLENSEIQEKMNEILVDNGLKPVTITLY